MNDHPCVAGTFWSAMSALQPVEFNPPLGVVLTETDKLVVGRYTSSNMCRFIRGKLQKRGGWIAITTSATMGTKIVLNVKIIRVFAVFNQ